VSYLCVTCDGTGILSEKTFYAPRDYCDDCDGTGRIEEEQMTCKLCRMKSETILKLKEQVRQLEKWSDGICDYCWPDECAHGPRRKPDDKDRPESTEEENQVELGENVPGTPSSDG